MKKKFHLLALIYAATLIGSNVNAQTGYAYTEKKDSLFSETLKENRPINIFLPEGYEKENIKYPVIYIIDGETRCTHAVPTVRFISSEGLMPKSIIVGIPNVNRDRDFLPPRVNNPVASDSADDFLRFFTGELFTYMEKHYRVDPFRVLIGHSYGGLFAMHALLTRPDAFEAYIMIDPSFWYGSKMMIQKAGDFFAGQQTLPKTIYISGNEGQAWKGMANDVMDSVLKAAAPKDLQWKTVAYANENHGSVTFKTIYDGLRFIFSDYRSNIGQLIPAKGMIVKDKPYDVAFFTDLKTLYYTIDGTRPTYKSLSVQPDSTHKASIKIDKTCTLSIISTPRFEWTKMITGEYKVAEPLEPVKKPGLLKNGLRYKAYEGTWDSLPDYSKLKPYTTGIVKNFTFPDSAKKDYFGVQYEGYLYAAEEGYYDITVSSDDGSRLFINNNQIIDNDGLHNANACPTYRLYLKKGQYNIRIDFFEKAGGQELNLEFVKYPWVGEPDGKIPDELLFYKE
jgi:predicted alpha/beta superfamily hydrolase